MRLQHLCGLSNVLVKCIEEKESFFLTDRAQIGKRSQFLLCLSFHDSLPVYFGLFLKRACLSLWEGDAALESRCSYLSWGCARERFLWTSVSFLAARCRWLDSVPHSFSTLSQTTVVIRITNCALLLVVRDTLYSVPFFLIHTIREFYASDMHKQ